MLVNNSSLLTSIPFPQSLLCLKGPRGCQVRCNHCAYGCGWRGRLDESATHQAVCPVVENVTLNRRLAIGQKRIFDLETDQKKGLKIMSSLKASWRYLGCLGCLGFVLSLAVSTGDAQRSGARGFKAYEQSAKLSDGSKMVQTYYPTIPYSGA